MDALKIFNLFKYGIEINIGDDSFKDISINPIGYNNLNIPKPIKAINTNVKIKIIYNFEWIRYE